jgi:hypothetical protein
MFSIRLSPPIVFEERKSELLEFYQHDPESSNREVISETALVSGEMENERYFSVYSLFNRSQVQKS